MRMFSRPEISGSMPTAEVEHRRDLPQHPRLAPRRLVDARHEPQQRGLARAVVPDQRHPVAWRSETRDVAQRLDDRHLRVGADLPPARPSTAFFSERVLASKIGKSTRRAFDVDARPWLHPVSHAGAVVAQADAAQRRSRQR